MKGLYSLFVHNPIVSNSRPWSMQLSFIFSPVLGFPHLILLYLFLNLGMEHCFPLILDRPIHIFLLSDFQHWQPPFQSINMIFRMFELSECSCTVVHFIVFLLVLGWGLRVSLFVGSMQARVPFFNKFDHINLINRDDDDQRAMVQCQLLPSSIDCYTIRNFDDHFWECVINYLLL